MNIKSDITSPEVLYEIIYNSYYPDITKLCTSNKLITSWCRLPYIAKLIRQRQIEYKMDRFLQNLQNHLDPITEASKLGDVEIVDELIHRGYNPSTNNNLAIRLASENGHLPVVNRLLQDNRVNPTADNNYAIRWASLNGRLPVVKRLLQDDRVRNSLDPKLLQEYIGQIKNI